MRERPARTAHRPGAADGCGAHPAKVRKTLNGLGYVDEHIHGLKQDGKATRFYLDLREKGGRLCEAGLAAGERTAITVCAVPATGPFAVRKTQQWP
ncbi:hypothetical protein ACFVZD_32645 [Streptomyces sp. NPDC058287]|uniref:hypothetical protein n=1 Tax=unclassified Streptomyces TaxID=2593676 RepID=UPI0036ED3E52